DRAAVELGDVAHDGEPVAAARGRLVEPLAALEQGGALGLGQAGAVILDAELDAALLGPAGELDARATPFAGIVEQAAEHLLELLALAAEGEVGLQPAGQGDRPLGT